MVSVDYGFPNRLSNYFFFFFFGLSGFFGTATNSANAAVLASFSDGFDFSCESFGYSKSAIGVRVS